MAEQAPFYIFTAFVFSYATGTLKMSRDFVLEAVLAASLLSFITIPLSGHISDRIGRRRMYLIGAAGTRPVGFVFFRVIHPPPPSPGFIPLLLVLFPPP